MKIARNLAGIVAATTIGMMAGVSLPDAPEAPWHAGVPISVYDGDTFTASLDLGYGVVIVERFRLDGIDTPEVTGPTKSAGERSRDVVRAMIEGKPVEIQAHGQEKYGRWLARVRVSGKDLTSELLRLKLGREYHGEKR